MFPERVCQCSKCFKLAKTVTLHVLVFNKFTKTLTHDKVGREFFTHKITLKLWANACVHVFSVLGEYLGRFQSTASKFSQYHLYENDSSDDCTVIRMDYRCWLTIGTSCSSSFLDILYHTFNAQH